MIQRSRQLNSGRGTFAAVFSSVETEVTLISDFETHLAGGAGDDAEGSFVVARV